MDLSAGIKAIIPSLEGDVYRVLARTTTPLSGLRIAELAGTGSAPGIRGALRRLLRQGTVLSTSAGASTMYTANRDHVLWEAIEQAVVAAEGSLTVVGERIAALAAELGQASREAPATIAIFGSVARGTSGIDSDIDLVAVFATPDMTTADHELVDELHARVPLWTGNECNVYAISVDRLGELVAAGDPVVAAWATESVTVTGADLRGLIEVERGLHDRVHL